MQVIEAGVGYALCRGRDETRRIDTLLVGDQPVGTWLLVFLDAAREVMTQDDAEKTANALQALELALSGETEFDHLFADLIDRDPPRPAHLQQQVIDSTSTEGND